MVPELGVIEGYFGRPWTSAERRHVAAGLGRLGYSFFHYAPKADRFLRREWRRFHPDRALDELAALSAHCRGLGLRFGVGLSPCDLYRDFSGAAKADFLAKLAAIDAIGVDDLAILFDDMRGDVADLAAKQAEIVHAAAAATRATRVLTCPTYYSDDAMLDVVFGARPAGYLDDLGRRLDPRIAVYWTGEEICSREFSPGHLRRVAGSLRRKPTLWDNYPVNDGPRMSRFLHLRGFTGRGSRNASCIAAHGINPALQPHLTMIPAATLVASYREGDEYCAMNAFREAARAVAGPVLASMLERDLFALQDEGLERLHGQREALRARYAAIAHPIAREITQWLDGRYTVESWEPESALEA